MKRPVRVALFVFILVSIGVVYALSQRRPGVLRLTGIVTTDTVLVSPEIQGRLQELSVKQGDIVKAGQLLGRIQPQEWKADMAFYTSSEEQSVAQVAQAEADLSYQEAQTSNQIAQAEANLAAAKAVAAQGSADLENSRLTFERSKDLFQRGVESAQVYDQARTGFEAAQAHTESLLKQVQAADAAVALARANAQQVIARHAMLEASRKQLAAAAAQREKAQVRLDYTEIHAPISGIVDVRAALPGEVVSPGQAVVTLINPDDLWVRIDVEETYIDEIRLGQVYPVRLPSGAERPGTVIYRGVDADFATQRDVSRTKRDIKTFEVRLRVDNSDRALSVGMTAYVTLRLAK